MEPLRIRAHLLDGRVAGTEHFFPIDSILAAAWIQRKYPEQFYSPTFSDFIEAKLPLERRGTGDRWWWAASFQQARPLKEYTYYWHRRFDDDQERYLDFQGRRGKVDGSAGRYKAYRMPLNILLLPYLEWYVVGEAAAIWDLLGLIVAVGKKPSQGLGLVDRWEVEPWPEDWSEVANGRLMRAMYNLPPGCKSVARFYGMRPPYWRQPERVWVPC